MSLGVASGYPQLVGLTTPLPVWSTRLLAKFYPASVAANISNVDYEGDITKMGETVRIRTTPTTTVTAHTKGETITYEHLEPATIDLVVDKALKWAFAVSIIDIKQADYAFIDDWAEDASEQMKIAIDTDMLGTVYSQAHASNQGTAAGADDGDVNLGSTASPLQITKNNVIEWIVNMGSVMNQMNVPENDRKLVIPPWVHAAIANSDIKDASLTGDPMSPVRSGRVGMIYGFETYVSNLLAKTGTGSSRRWHVIACQRNAISFASQITETNFFPQLESQYGSAMRGLQVYGYKVLKPEALVYSQIKK